MSIKLLNVDCMEYMKDQENASFDLCVTSPPYNMNLRINSNGDVLEQLKNKWDLILSFPPCTYLACSGAKHFAKKREDGRQQQGIDFFMKFANAECKKIVIENPVGIMSTKFRKPDQIIQPWQFGDKFQKTTCLWLKGLPLLKHTLIVGKGEFVTTPSGKKLPKWYSDDKSSKNRSKTFPGIAKAMAEQWSIKDESCIQKSLFEGL